jgi:MHS family proline/betaine transporter-like MFS transporter
MSNISNTKLSLSNSQILLAIVAGVVGNTVEWVDWAIYGLLSPIIAKQLFPPGDMAVALMQTYGVFFLGFLARPFGATVLGVYGDRHGRTKTLAICIILMAVGTGALGLVPTYEQVGILCPALVLLCRIAQGFAAGAEWGTATTFLYEYAPPHRRAWYSSWRPFGTGLGVFIAGAVISVTTAILSTEVMAAWGWRVPFIIGMVIGFFGLYIRLKVPETPEFAKAEEAKEISQTPLAESWRTEKIGLLILSGLACGGNVTYYYLFTYIPTYLSTQGLTSFATAMDMNTIDSLVYSLSIPIVGWFCDRYKKRAFVVLSMAGFTVLAYPIFWMFDTGSYWVILSSLLLFAIFMGFFWGAVPVIITELFPTRIRNTSVSVGYTWSTSLFGGTAPMVATWLNSITGSTMAAAAYLLVTSALTLWAVLKCPNK